MTMSRNIEKLHKDAINHSGKIAGFDMVATALSQPRASRTAGEWMQAHHGRRVHRFSSDHMYGVVHESRTVDTGPYVDEYTGEPYVRLGEAGRLYYENVNVVHADSNVLVLAGDYFATAYVAED